MRRHKNIEKGEEVQARYSPPEEGYLDVTKREAKKVRPKEIRSWRESKGESSIRQIEKEIKRLRLGDVADSRIISEAENIFQEYFSTKKIFKTDIGRILPCEDMLDAHIRDNGGSDHSDEFKKEIIQGYIKRSKAENIRNLIPSAEDKDKWKQDLHEKYGDRVKVLSNPNIRYNCHAFTLTFREDQRSPDGNVSQWIPNHDVRTIIADQGYPLVATNENFSKETVNNIAANPKSYFILYGEDAAHSGRFSMNKEGKLLVDKEGNPFVDSKWGAEGKVRHPISVGEEEYGKTWEIYYTGRPEGPHLQEITESF